MGNQALLLFGPVVCTAGNDSRHRLVAVANQHFFAVLYELDVSAELRFQVADVHGTHRHIVTNLTMLVMFILVLVNANTESRRKAYYLMSVHEHLPPQARQHLKEIGWTKGRELAKVARRDGRDFDCAPWVHKSRSMPREDFRREVEKELTGKEEEPSELIYFKVYESQIPVIEQAIETAALMLGTDKSRGYCLEMICADFLAGANLDSGQPNVLLYSISRFFKFLPSEQRRAFVEQITEKAS